MPNKRQRLMDSGGAESSQQAAATQALADTPMELWSYAPTCTAADSVPTPGGALIPISLPILVSSCCCSEGHCPAGMLS